VERLLGGKRGRLITSDERKLAVTLINEAVESGSRIKPACEIIGITIRTLQNWRRIGFQDRRKTKARTPVNKLSQSEQRAILELCNTKEFQSMSPKQIVPILADKQIYLASESSFYRILRKADQLKHRGKTAIAKKRAKPEEYIAYYSNQVWSWDITYLASDIKGKFFFLYLFMDIFSRKIVGWDIYENELSEHASEIFKRTCFAEGVSNSDKIVLHSDNGKPMKGATMLATLQSLGVIASFSRPSVSNDNPYSEAMFKTLKYIPSYPNKPFKNVEEARKWVSEFVYWYNNVHRHSSIKYVTPEQRHSGKDIEILKQRKNVYNEARAEHPERWSKNIRNWDYIPVEILNPGKNTLNKRDKKIAA
jgi:putative transposase